MNLKTFLSYLDNQISLKEIEQIPEYPLGGKKNFNYTEKDEKNKKFKDLIGNFKDEDIKTILICDQKLIIVLKQYIKVYNYKSGNCIATIENLYEPDSAFILTQLFEDLFSVTLYKSDNQTILKIFSIKSNNKILFEKSFEPEIYDIKKFSDYSFGLLLRNNCIEIYKSSESFQEISDSLCLKENYSINFENIGKVKIPGIIDFAYIPSGSYLVALIKNEIIIYNQELKIHKKINNEFISSFNSLDQLNDGNLILGGYYIGMINKKNLSLSIAYDDDIPKSKISYLSGTETDINYSQFTLISSHKLVCKKYFKQYIKISYEDIPDESHQQDCVCTFKYNPKTCKLKLIQTLRYIDVDKIFTNKKGEIFIQIDNNIEYL